MRDLSASDQRLPQPVRAPVGFFAHAGDEARTANDVYLPYLDESPIEPPQRSAPADLLGSPHAKDEPGDQRDDQREGRRWTTADVSLINPEDTLRLSAIRRLTHTGWAADVALSHTPNPQEASVSQETLMALYAQARRDLFGANYWRRRWGRTLSPTATKLVEVLRSHCYHNRQTHDVRDTYFCDYQALADEVHTSVTAVKRLLMNQAPDPSRYPAWICSDWLLLRRIIVKCRRRRWLPANRGGARHVGMSIASNSYVIALDDPCLDGDLPALRRWVHTTLCHLQQVTDQRAIFPATCGGTSETSDGPSQSASLSDWEAAALQVLDQLTLAELAALRDGPHTQPSDDLFQDLTGVDQAASTGVSDLLRARSERPAQSKVNPTRPDHSPISFLSVERIDCDRSEASQQQKQSFSGNAELRQRLSGSYLRSPEQLYDGFAHPREELRRHEINALVGDQVEAWANAWGWQDASGAPLSAVSGVPCAPRIGAPSPVEQLGVDQSGMQQIARSARACRETIVAWLTNRGVPLEACFPLLIWARGRLQRREDSVLLDTSGSEDSKDGDGSGWTPNRARGRRQHRLAPIRNRVAYFQRVVRDDLLDAAEACQWQCEDQEAWEAQEFAQRVAMQQMQRQWAQWSVNGAEGADTPARAFAGLASSEDVQTDDLTRTNRWQDRWQDGDGDDYRQDACADDPERALDLAAPEAPCSLQWRRQRDRQGQAIGRRALAEVLQQIPAAQRNWLDQVEVAPVQAGAISEGSARVTYALVVPSAGIQEIISSRFERPLYAQLTRWHGMAPIQLVTIARGQLIPDSVCAERDEEDEKECQRNPDSRDAAGDVVERTAGCVGHELSADPDETLDAAAPSRQAAHTTQTASNTPVSPLTQRLDLRQGSETLASGDPAATVVKANLVAVTADVAQQVVVAAQGGGQPEAHDDLGTTAPDAPAVVEEDNGQRAGQPNGEPRAAKRDRDPKGGYTADHDPSVSSIPCHHPYSGGRSVGNDRGGAVARRATGRAGPVGASTDANADAFAAPSASAVCNACSIPRVGSPNVSSWSSFAMPSAPRRHAQSGRSPAPPRGLATAVPPTAGDWQADYERVEARRARLASFRAAYDAGLAGRTPAAAGAG